MKNIDFSKILETGQILQTRFGLMILKPYKIGELRLTSGKLVACDPLVFLLGTEGFNTDLKPGCYPVILSVAYNQNNEEPIVAYAMLRLNEQTPVRWKMATKPGEDLTKLKEGEAFGYYVDSGIGCFMDADAAQVLVDSTLEAETDEEDLTSELDELLEQNTSLGFMWANMCIDKSTGANVIAFSVGVGDGFYPSYFGYDADNNIVSVVTVCLSGNL